MTASAPTWAGDLQESLGQWAQGRPDLAGRGLQRVVEQLTGPDHALWRALVLNQLALLAHELSHWDYSREQWQAARQAWSDCGLRPDDSGLAPSLSWFCQLLESQGFRERGQELTRRRESGVPPLLDPWQAPPALAPSVPLALASETAEPWDELLSRALQLSRESRLPQALGLLDQARAQAVEERERDQGHLLCLVYNAEALACFQAGDYAAAGESRSEAHRLWASLGERPAVFIDPINERFAQALTRAGLDGPAATFAERIRQKRFPLLDPWEDLESGLPQGHWEKLEFRLERDWRVALDSILRLHMRAQYGDALRELGLLEQRLNLDQRRQAPGVLLRQIQALVCHAAGDYGPAQEIYTQAAADWDALTPPQRRQEPFLGELRALLSLHELSWLADAIGNQLVDPFQSPESASGMQKHAPAEVEESFEADPREGWERKLGEAWKLAGEGRWGLAQRRAAHSEQIARLLGAHDLRVAYSLNSQALFAQASGSYSDAENLMQDATLVWRRGGHSPAARTAWSETVDLLEAAGWTDVSARLQAIWKKPESRSALNPALLPVDSLAQSSMQIMTPTTPDPEEDDGVLRLPTAPAAPRPQARGKRPIWAVLVLGALAAAAWWISHG